MAKQAENLKRRYCGWIMTETVLKMSLTNLGEENHSLYLLMYDMRYIILMIYDTDILYSYLTYFLVMYTQIRKIPRFIIILINISRLNNDVTHSI